MTHLGERSTAFRVSSYAPWPGVVVVEVSGELDMATEPCARRFLATCTEGRPRHLVVDLTGVSFLPSQGLQMLMAAHLGRDGIHGALHVVGVGSNRHVRHVLELTGLARELDVHDDLPGLLARLGGQAEG